MYVAWHASSDYIACKHGLYIDARKYVRVNYNYIIAHHHSTHACIPVSKSTYLAANKKLMKIVRLSECTIYVSSSGNRDT